MVYDIQPCGDWYTGRWWVGCYIWYSEERPGRAAAPSSPLLAVPNVTAHLSTASVPTSYYSIWHCNCLCALKGLKNTTQNTSKYAFSKISKIFMGCGITPSQTSRRFVGDAPPHTHSAMPLLFLTMRTLCNVSLSWITVCCNDRSVLLCLWRHDWWLLLAYFTTSSQVKSNSFFETTLTVRSGWPYRQNTGPWL